MCVDILTRLGAAFSFSGLETGRVAFDDDIHVVVVTPRTLHELKKDTLRLKDRADAAMLKGQAGLIDEEEDGSMPASSQMIDRVWMVRRAPVRD